MLGIIKLYQWGKLAACAPALGDLKQAGQT
jgi:hypothetical protein